MRVCAAFARSGCRARVCAGAGTRVSVSECQRFIEWPFRPFVAPDEAFLVDLNAIHCLSGSVGTPRPDVQSFASTYSSHTPVSMVWRLPYPCHMDALPTAYRHILHSGGRRGRRAPTTNAKQVPSRGRCHAGPCDPSHGPLTPTAQCNNGFVGALVSTTLALQLSASVAEGVVPGPKLFASVRVLHIRQWESRPSFPRSAAAGTVVAGLAH